MSDANPVRCKMPALGETLDMGSGYTIRHGGVLYYGLHVIRHGGVVIGTARSFDEAGGKIERHVEERFRGTTNQEPSHADR